MAYDFARLVSALLVVWLVLEWLFVAKKKNFRWSQVGT